MAIFRQTSQTIPGGDAVLADVVGGMEVDVVEPSADEVEVVSTVVAPPAPRFREVAEVDSQTRPADGEAAYPETWCWVSTVFLLVVGGAFGAYAHDHWTTGVTFTPPRGVGIFALFYIIAQVIERIQEPFAPFVRAEKTEEQDEGGSAAKVNKRKAQALLERTTAEAINAPTEMTRRKVANAKRTADQVRVNTTLLLFGTGSFLAMAAAGLLKPLLLRTVGAAGVPVWLDVVVTGLAIGGGTKALHDLISNIQKAKEEKEDAKATGATP